MKTTHQILRERLKVPLKDDPTNTQGMTLEERERFNWDTEFVELMKWRMMQGSFRYGIQLASMGTDNLAYAEVKIEQYKKTGNLESLVDAANMLRLEFKFSRHPKKHFNSGDTGIHYENR